MKNDCLWIAVVKENDVGTDKLESNDAFDLNNGASGKVHNSNTGSCRCFLLEVSGIDFVHGTKVFQVLQENSCLDNVVECCSACSQNFLDILEPTDVFALLHQMPSCSVVVTTGGKASEEICAYFNSKGIDVKVPKVGENVSINSDLWTGVWWRMPSSSRAYPMKLEKKAEYYKLLFS